jgi:hypothetical protein
VYVIRKRIITRDQKLLLIGILPESVDWNQKNFVLLKEFHHPLYKDCFSSDPGMELYTDNKNEIFSLFCLIIPPLEHLNFIGMKKKKREDECPYVVVSVSKKGNKVYFAEQTPVVSSFISVSCLPPRAIGNGLKQACLPNL